MAVNYGYYLPLAPELYDSVRFIDIAEKTEGLGDDQPQKHDKDGTPQWTVSALVRYAGRKAETETFTLTAPLEVAEAVNNLPELAPIRLLGLAAGKWSRGGSDKTAWSFSITGVQADK